MTVDLDRQASRGTADFVRRMATTEVGFPPDFFPSFFSFLAISLRSAKLVYGNRFRFFAIY